jgi:moderate conductance mechanosensitive channel
MNYNHFKTWVQPDTYYIIISNCIETVLIAAIAFIFSSIIESVIQRFCNAARERAGAIVRINKLNTIQSILFSVARYSIASIALFNVLLIWGVPRDSLTVGSAILASAVGFGSQGLIQDMISGFSFLFEEQLRIGDFVEINGKQGYVKEVGLRVVKIEGVNGDVHIFFNRNIAAVTNLKTHPPA